MRKKTPMDTKTQLDRVLKGMTDKDIDFQVLVDSPLLDEPYTYPAGTDGRPFHLASVGKLFTSALILQLIEEGMISFTDKIEDHIPVNDLDGLFLYNGEDVTGDVTVLHLLTHTSGLSDHFTDQPREGPGFIELIQNDKERFWTPGMILDYYRMGFGMVGEPGRRFHYSDTGFILLGLMIENVTGTSFHENLHSRIFDPLGMRHSHLMLRSSPQENREMAKVNLDGVDMTEHMSLSADWAGGGVVASPSDLNRFIRAFFNGGLFDKGLLETHMDFPNRFRKGIQYGTAMMELHMEGFFFLLRGWPRLRGHLGILSTHAWYDPESDTSFVMNFGSDKMMMRSVRTLINLLGTLIKAGR